MSNYINYDSYLKETMDLLERENEELEKERNELLCLVKALKHIFNKYLGNDENEKTYY